MVQVTWRLSSCMIFSGKVENVNSNGENDTTFDEIVVYCLFLKGSTRTLRFVSG